MSISTISDTVYTYRFIKILVTPFEKTEAYGLGLIDENGKRTDKQISSSKERAAYTHFHRIVFNIKKLLAMAPGGKSRIASYASALLLLKEEYGINHNKVLSELSLTESEVSEIKKSVEEEEDATTTADVAIKDTPLTKKPLKRKKPEIEEAVYTTTSEFTPTYKSKKLESFSTSLDKNLIEINIWNDGGGVYRVGFYVDNKHSLHKFEKDRSGKTTRIFSVVVNFLGKYFSNKTEYKPTSIHVISDTGTKNFYKNAFQHLAKRLNMDIQGPNGTVNPEFVLTAK